MARYTVDQLRADLLGESKVDPGLLVRMQAQLSGLEARQSKLERNPMIWLGRNLHWAGGAIGLLIVALSGPVLGNWIKHALHLP